jgi:putative transposase
MIFELLRQQQAPPFGLSVTKRCAVFALGRVGYYRDRLTDAERDTELRDHIQRVALEWPQYGYRRITAQLHREGITANHKCVLRLMREDNLLCLRKRRFVCTTD